MIPRKLDVVAMAAPKCTYGCPLLDRCLGGGLPCRSVTELSGESGCGKTQLCLQLLLSAQLPPSLGGLSASSLYLHSEFPFPLRRLRRISTPESLRRIFVRPLDSPSHLLDALSEVHSLLAALAPTPFPLRLLVIDSIAALFRSDFGPDPSALLRRSSLFFTISASLRALAERYGLAVFITNQVVDVMEGSSSGVRIGNLSRLYSSGRQVAPALGLAWANCVNSRLFMSKTEEVVGEEGIENGGCMRTRRRLHVLFAPHLPESSCEFEIRAEGVVGIGR